MDYQAVFDKIWATLDQITEEQKQITASQLRSEAEHIRIQKKMDDFAKSSAERSARVDAQIDRVDKQLGEMGNRLFFPTYANMHIMGAVAGMVIPDHVAQMAMKAGLFVIAPSGDTVRLLNSMSFKPRTWNQVDG
ncbi:MAG: hypothetical protein H7833_04605 [Magnetococcus sp. DMHC-1]|nr:hypothetical protein [Magnetococcales bacterium]